MYFVSTREENDHNARFGGAWGYFWDNATAVDAVHRNVTDMHETIYPYAIIEHLEPGLFPVPKERRWFGWQEEKQGFYEIEPPECDKCYPCNFSIALGTICNEHSAHTESLPNIVDQNSPNYFITVMRSDDSEGEHACQCGFFHNRETAFQAVQENWGGIHRSNYDVALIECIMPGIIAWSLERTWFRWDNNAGKYCDAEVPEAFADYPPAPYYPVAFL